MDMFIEVGKGVSEELAHAIARGSFLGGHITETDISHMHENMPYNVRRKVLILQVLPNV